MRRKLRLHIDRYVVALSTLAAEKHRGVENYVGLYLCPERDFFGSASVVRNPADGIVPSHEKAYFMCLDHAVTQRIGFVVWHQPWAKYRYSLFTFLEKKQKPCKLFGNEAQLSEYVTQFLKEHSK